MSQIPSGTIYSLASTSNTLQNFSVPTSQIFAPPPPNTHMTLPHFLNVPAHNNIHSAGDNSDSD
ncbi:hypothetical protein SERLA73DRAFT_167346 [Serpula lacrymans var. lacrymans S7.3]|uniref:Uncharacterized protein n=2 Tax=Serpula lacrymans var. lacrymans TaxID=341189 RepID=F8PS40_SERL3|nr:uncharacterized protein SERLADRAFT_447986 [Serpula lacrymans var. lacrymans S7.9]EGO01222.1 hypothetical protein SERLA73DRAFT_167346 [Serpula lacrymans var. lacrymans S7.3]EGO26871.1 hypothetical protein SERLADRAFT_447986 [Serpula lacrymans var. lacrymans S7.9]